MSANLVEYTANIHYGHAGYCNTVLNDIFTTKIMLEPGIVNSFHAEVEIRRILGNLFNEPNMIMYLNQVNTARRFCSVAISGYEFPMKLTDDPRCRS